jgi:predicted nucleic acid-binding protein
MADIEMSAIAWYEFCRGPRTPEQLAVARDLLGPGGIIIALDAGLAEAAGEVFASLGRPRRRANDIAIAVTARERSATLLTRNSRDFARIAGITVEEVGA